MKKFIYTMMMAMAAVMLTAGMAMAQPTEIRTAQQLHDIRDNLNGNYVLMDDIDLGVAPWNEGEGWEPIGDWNYLDPSVLQFTGSLDGNGFVIRGLRINRSSTDRVGLFGIVGDGGKVSGVLLEDVNIVGSRVVGAVVGDNAGTIENCVVTGTVSGVGDGDAVGGVVGVNYRTVKDNVALLASVSGSYYVGRVVGENADGSLTNNSAWSGMTVTEGGTAKDPLDETDGANMTTEDARELLEDLKMTIPNYLRGEVPEYPILVATAADLDDIRNGLDKHYRLAANIDLTEFLAGNTAGWLPIGDAVLGNNFTGSLTNDGGYVIKGLRIERSGTNDVGLFGNVPSGGTVSGLLLENVNIVGQYRVGAVAGTGNGIIENCVVTGTVSGDGNNVGGVVGTNAGTVSDNVALLGSVSGAVSVGRVVGINNYGILSNNRAWSGMTVNGNTVTSTNGASNHGADMSIEAARALLEYNKMTIPNYLRGEVPEYPILVATALTLTAKIC